MICVTASNIPIESRHANISLQWQNHIQINGQLNIRNLMEKTVNMPVVMDYF